MHFTELKIKSFGKHIEKKVKFTPGLNIIVGESETGKTTLIRALYLLLENSPRGGEKLYQSWYSDSPLSIELKDDKGNIVKRKKNKYYLNNNKPLKAFGSLVPEPIKEIFNLKEINWQRQLDSHFLIFNTGGASAKLLNSATGMGDQEAIISDIKEKILKSKTEIKRLRKNNIEYEETTTKLKNIVRYKLKSEAILYLKEKSNNLKNNIEILEQILFQLSEIENIKNKFEKIKPYINKIKIIKKEFEEFKNTRNEILELESMLNELNKIKIVNPNIINRHYKSLQTVQSQILELVSLINKADLLKNILNSISERRNEQLKLKKQIIEQKEKIDKTFKELGYCPLCKRKIENDYSCCR